MRLQTPSVAVVEMLQCLSQAVPLSMRKPKGKDVDPATLLLQLPHFDMDVVRKLKRQRVGTFKGAWCARRHCAPCIAAAACCPPYACTAHAHLHTDTQMRASARTHTYPRPYARANASCVATELQDMEARERMDALGQAGLRPDQAEEVCTFLSVLPTVHVRARVQLDGEEGIVERDIAKCTVRVRATQMHVQRLPASLSVVCPAGEAEEGQGAHACRSQRSMALLTGLVRGSS